MYSGATGSVHGPPGHGAGSIPLPRVVVTAVVGLAQLFHFNPGHGDQDYYLDVADITTNDVWETRDLYVDLVVGRGSALNSSTWDELLKRIATAW